MKLPSLSVILPNFNHGKLLPVAVGAILNQSVKPTEIIIIDDGSTDNSVEVIKGLAAQSPIVKLYQNDRNRGVSYTLNRGIDLAASDYVCFPGADDEISPGYIEKSLALLAQHPQAGLSCTIGDWREVDTGLNWHMGVGMTDRPAYLSPQQMLALEKRGRLYIPGHSVIFRRDALLEAGKFIPELKYAVDWFADYVVGFRYGICVVPEPLAVFNIYSKGYYHREQKDPAKTREVLARMMEFLNGPTYAQSAALIREGGSLYIFAMPMLKLLWNQPAYRKFLTPTFLRKALWRSIMLLLKKITPRPLGNLYFKISGYRARTASNASAHP